MAATTSFLIDLAWGAASVFLIASLVTCVLVVADRLLGTPPPGHTVKRFERTVAALFVVFLAVGPLYLISLIVGVSCS